MCRKTMDIKKEHIETECFRRIVIPRCGLRLLRVSTHHDEALRHFRRHVMKSTIRKYFHREKKRVKIAQSAKETEKVAAIQSSGPLCLPSPGAMAPENTTQYLMDRFYKDELQMAKVVRLPSSFQQKEELGLPQDVDTADSFDSFLAFHQRDFEEQFGALWSPF